MSGLVAARLDQGVQAELGSAPRVRPAAADASEPGAAAASLELGPARPEAEQRSAEQLRQRQENILRIQTRMTALEDAGRLLADARDGGEAGLTALAAQGPELSGRIGSGGPLIDVLNDARSAAGDPAKFRSAEVEAAGALLLARGENAGERAALDRDMVGAENEVAGGVDVERVERAAAPLRGQGEPEDLQALSEALRASPVSRSRVLDLLVGGSR